MQSSVLEAQRLLHARYHACDRAPATCRCASRPGKAPAERFPEVRGFAPVNLRSKCSSKRCALPPTSRRVTEKRDTSPCNSPPSMASDSSSPFRGFISAMRLESACCRCHPEGTDSQAAPAANKRWNGYQRALASQHLHVQRVSGRGMLQAYRNRQEAFQFV